MSVILVSSHPNSTEARESTAGGDGGQSYRHEASHCIDPGLRLAEKIHLVRGGRLGGIFLQKRGKTEEGCIGIVLQRFHYVLKVRGKPVTLHDVVIQQGGYVLHLHGKGRHVPQHIFLLRPNTAKEHGM